eukprot:TRINITY_DN16433_c0_g1_i3.p1 TRINITY_DN16433_c0_g1~~TRINITY_DN16433_c0_g1_i3.p1  ORF type:complete len:354 (-),score=133.77 TRINITY_DN16433_c0_g1_i3:287-1348(-)
MAGGAAQQLEVIRQFESGNDIRQMISNSEGGRALRLLKKREETKQNADTARKIIEEETKKRKFSNINDKFGGSSADVLEEEFKRQTVGLMSVAEFKAKRQAIDDIIQAQQTKDKNKNMKKKKAINSKKLSFEDDDMDDDSDDDDDDDEDEEKEVPMKRGFGKNPNADTSFLFDTNREVDMLRKKQELIDEYNKMEEKAKKDKLEVIYSYWDGTGHRRNIHIEKGFTIGQFLAKAKSDLEKTDFPELRTVGLDNLMYVKEDLIIPSNITFHELIKERARGKTGPLFNFDVKDDLRISDVRVQRDDSHAGKIVDRKWYERNKHIFPANRWEIFSKDRQMEQKEIVGDIDTSKIRV